MKPFATIFCAVLLVVSSASCKKHSNGTASGDYLIIGTAGGFVGGASEPYYFINGTQFKKDTSLKFHTPPSDNNAFNFSIVLPSPAFDSVKGLLQQIPAELISGGSQSIGGIWPDFGYTEVRASINGKQYVWLFQADITKSSQAVQDFEQKVHVVFNYN